MSSSIIKNVEYKEILDEFKSYEGYKEKLIEFNKMSQYDKKLLKKIINFNFDRFFIILKLLSIPLGILLIIVTGADIIDSLFKAHTRDILNNILHNNTASIVFNLYILLFIYFLTKVYHIRDDYKYIKYALFVSILYLQFDQIDYDFKYIISITVLFFNIYVFFKYKHSLLKFNKIPLPCSEIFVCKHKKERV